MGTGYSAASERSREAREVVHRLRHLPYPLWKTAYWLVSPVPRRERIRVPYPLWKAGFAPPTAARVLRATPGDMCAVQGLGLRLGG